MAWFFSKSPPPPTRPANPSPPDRLSPVITTMVPYRGGVLFATVDGRLFHVDEGPNGGPQTTHIATLP